MTLNLNTPKNILRAENIRGIVNGLEEYWPLTLRQVHYQAVVAEILWGMFKGSKIYYENSRNCYQTLSRLLVQMRIDAIVPWEAIQDSTRPVGERRGMEDVTQHVSAAENWFRRYERCVAQGQEHYVEVWTEKTALWNILERVTMEYCVRLASCRGFSSGTMDYEYLQRARTAYSRGQRPVLLFLSDFDPSGMSMLPAIEKRFRVDFEFPYVEFRRVALTLEQISEYNLPNNPDALKQSDPRARAFIEQYGTCSVELDALHPRDLQAIVRSAIEVYVDTELMEEQREIESEERARLAEFREAFTRLRRDYDV
jgi:hypothetical protein